ncbi:Nucleotide-binding universal stress protein, UspA family [Halopenitus malekzadehii]|uniref:Nucleotide-binding universal stress protein, UspA family n=1 Tax=Halopenitus malekzadehii TaxID=1267564 RepID=A0A1H6JVS1_9EURY|nr:universal stress protein [Halopenitus malekzadehii]SEH63408.1 Nucleotide-binding universal stress protein, UspA family [Halopenitus malekzadehii]
MYETILVPTDGSEAAMEAAKHAYSLGERYNATVHVLAVVEQSESASIVGRGDEKLETLREEGTDSTKRLVEEAQSRDIDALGAVEVGDPDRAILKYGNEHDIDLIVMSTNARSGVGRFLRGSVTEKVIRDGDIPVLAVQR